jgi:hypothetical protein
VTEAQIHEFLTAVAPLIGADPPKPQAGTFTERLETSRAPPTDRERAYAAKALQNTYANLGAMQQGGGRNQALNNAALIMGEMVTAGWIDRKVVEMALFEAARTNGYRAQDGDKEAWATLQSGLTAGMSNPRLPLPEAEPLGSLSDFIEQGNIIYLAGANSAGRKGAINATPFRWVDPSTIPRREWLYGSHYIRRFVSVTVAPGGAGKSSLAIAEALVCKRFPDAASVFCQMISIYLLISIFWLEALGSRDEY